MWTNKKYYDLIFKNTLDENINESYWLASRYFKCADNNGDFGICNVWIEEDSFKIFGGWLYHISRNKSNKYIYIKTYSFN